MKIQNIILALGAAALTLTAINAGASNVALSPRATAGQIIVVPGSADAALAPAASSTALSPRAAASQVAALSGTTAYAASCTPLGSPKYAVAAGKDAQLKCCNQSLGKCPTMSRMN